MKVTTAEIAAALGISERAVRKRASASSWSEPVDRVKGGGNVYELASLPLSKIELRKVRGQLAAQPLPVALAAEKDPAAPPAPLPALDETRIQGAIARADLLRLYTRHLASSPWGRRGQARDEFVVAYNSGVPWPHLYKQLGPVASWKTIEEWRRKLATHGGDIFALADLRGRARRGSCGLTPEQTDILLRCVLRPNRPRVSEAIRMAHAAMRVKGIANGHSAATYRRWLRGWVSTHYDLWVFTREGAKAWNDKCAMYIERDMSLLNVGDVIVADGHNLNFEILNPWTGKPKRMAMILFYDMASNMPLGWELMPTENTQAISSALRRAILRLGKYPRVVYLDNGKAFKSRFFAGSAGFDEAGYSGLYERIGCQTIFAWPYHGQSKTVERFFGTFAELERWCPTYTGTSIERKPPRMMRGETVHRRIHEKAHGEGFCVTMEQAHMAIAAWFDVYASRPQRGHLAGACPQEVFEAGRGPGVDKAELAFLMMSVEIKHIHRNGITFQGRHYYHPALANRRHKVTIRFDLLDQASIYVYDQDGEYLCEATPMEKVHPAAAHLGDEDDKAALRRHIEQKRGQERAAAGSAKALLEQEVMPAHQLQMEQIGMLGMTPKAEPKSIEHKQLSREEIAARIEEAEEAGRMFAEAEQAALNEELAYLSESDRYGRLMEMEMKGEELSAEHRTFLRLYEQSDEYKRDDYWTSRRAALAIVYGQKEKAAGDAAAEE